MDKVVEVLTPSHWIENGKIIIITIIIIICNKIRSQGHFTGYTECSAPEVPNHWFDGSLGVLEVQSDCSE